MSSRKSVLEYPTHFGDIKKQNEFVVSLVQQNGVETIITELETILVSGTIAQICDALLFLRDVCLFQYQEPSFSPIVNKFRKDLPVSDIFSIMESNLYSENQQVRHNTIFTFGKMTFKENLPRLQKAIKTYKTTYPNELEELLQELSWLENQKE